MPELTLKRVGRGGSKQCRLTIAEVKKNIRNLQYNLKTAAKYADKILDSRQIGDMGMRQDIAELIKKADRWCEAVGKW